MTRLAGLVPWCVSLYDGTGVRTAPGNAQVYPRGEARRRHAHLDHAVVKCRLDELPLLDGKSSLR